MEIAVLHPEVTLLEEEEGLSSGMEGILPIAQSTVYGKCESCEADYPITGSGEPLKDCGMFLTLGCDNIEEHRGITLFGVDFTNKVYLKRVMNSCYRPLCPTCWEKWASREAKRAVDRLSMFLLKGRILEPIHVVVSIPHVDYGLSLQQMRKKVYAALKRVHCIGGMVIFHSKRQHMDKSWYFSPHFHVVGYGWIVDVRKNYVYSGYVVKNVGIRKTVQGTIWYQLSHCAVAVGKHTITWFGALSYNKLKVGRNFEKERETCPICGELLGRFVWIGEGKNPLPDVEGFVAFDDPKNWERVRERFH